MPEARLQRTREAYVPQRRYIVAGWLTRLDLEAMIGRPLTADEMRRWRELHAQESCVKK